MKLRRTLVKRVAALVQANNHGEAIVVAANAFGLEKLIERAERINRLHYWLGHLPPTLYEERRSVYMELMNFAKSVLPPDDYQRLYSAF